MHNATIVMLVQIGKTIKLLLSDLYKFVKATDLIPDYIPEYSPFHKENL